jgi:predicted lipoprotein with Yx(FWY)xxD motif
MLNLVLAVVFLLACACGGYSDVPGLTTGDGDANGDGDATPQGDGDGDDIVPPGDGDGDGDGDAGTPEDDGEHFPDGEANLRFADNPDLGAILVDKDGRSLYMFLDDAAGAEKTKCWQGVCPDQWPAFDAEEVKAGFGVDNDAIDRFVRDDGKWQVTYKGYPLYYHAGDDAGEVTGNEIDGKWFVARDYMVFFFAQSLVRPQGTPAFNTPFLVDGNGRTLYIYKTDKPGSGGSTPVSSCADSTCLTKWPVWSPGSLDAAIFPSNIDPNAFGSFKRPDGKTQATFRGWPLYYFAPDQDKPGGTGGYNVGNWNVIDPLTFDGTIQ